MADSGVEQSPITLETIILDIARKAYRMEIEAREKSYAAGEDRFLTIEEAARIISVSPDWVYRRTKTLPFIRKLGPKMVRCSHNDLQKWMKTRRG
jgi:excisionase family DNA binding protein